MQYLLLNGRKGSQPRTLVLLLSGPNASGLTSNYFLSVVRYGLNEIHSELSGTRHTLHLSHHKLQFKYMHNHVLYYRQQALKTPHQSVFARMLLYLPFMTYFTSAWPPHDNSSLNTRSQLTYPSFHLIYRESRCLRHAYDAVVQRDNCHRFRGKYLSMPFSAKSSAF